MLTDRSRLFYQTERFVRLGGTPVLHSVNHILDFVTECPHRRFHLPQPGLNGFLDGRIPEQKWRTGGILKCRSAELRPEHRVERGLLVRGVLNSPVQVANGLQNYIS